ncbi:xanthine/uracil permease-related protein [Skeletonema marinoi]|uniref:Xanthine/uracil permease-related protein n=1 Tax=Skeletonema marinoi TaxID=267567 RepID=A0AAD8Y8D7_9STRA|nr:xanthine/uracil permease-related protein [Skeletonema marinoi]
MKFIEAMNERVDSSFIGKFFQIKERGSSFSTELAGATATFLTMAYILAVNPRILADSGGPCVVDPDDPAGIFGESYGECLEKIKQQYVTATAIGSMVGCLLMGLVANLPIALAPGMGMNAYFTYSVVGFRGTGSVSYQAACTAVMIEGAIFFVLALTGLRYRIIRLIPEPVRIATPAGIGAFLAHLGLQTAEGIGAVVGDIATAVTLGGCPPEKQTKLVAWDDLCRLEGICVPSDNYTCDVEGGIMTSGRTWLGLLGMMIIAVALGYRSKLSFIYGIALVTIVSWFRNTAVTYFPDDDAGNARFDYFKKVVDITGLDMIITPFTSDLANAGSLSLQCFTLISWTPLELYLALPLRWESLTKRATSQSQLKLTLSMLFPQCLDPSLVFLRLHPTSRVELVWKLERRPG